MKIERKKNSKWLSGKPLSHSYQRIRHATCFVHLFVSITHFFLLLMLFSIFHWRVYVNDSIFFIALFLRFFDKSKSISLFMLLVTNRISARATVVKQSILITIMTKKVQKHALCVKCEVQKHECIYGFYISVIIIFRFACGSHFVNCVILVESTPTKRNICISTCTRAEWSGRRGRKKNFLTERLNSSRWKMMALIFVLW